MTKIDLIKNKTASVFDSYQVSEASIFGSVARNEENKRSDVDFLIKFSPDQGGLFAMVRLKRDLEKILKKKVDLVTYRSLNPRLKKYILKDKILIYEKRR